MKKILLFLMIVVSVSAKGQMQPEYEVGYYRPFTLVPAYTYIAQSYVWIKGGFDSVFHVPAGTTATLRTGGWKRTGAVFYDSTGVDSGFYVYGSGGVWQRLARAAEIGGLAWGLTGTGGTVAGTNFIGTTDAVDLVFKTAGVQIARFPAANGSFNKFYFGELAGSGNTAINFNAMGYQAGQNNTGEAFNGFGFEAGENNTGEDFNGFGVSAGKGNTGRSLNGFGVSAGESNTGSHVNIMGENAGVGNAGTNVNMFGNFSGWPGGLSTNTFSNITLFGANSAASAAGQLVFNNGTANARFGMGTVSADRLYTMQNASGTVAFLSDITTVATAVPISGLTAATGTNTINNVAHTQEWDWESLTSGQGLILGSTSLTSGILLNLSVNGTAAATNQTAFRILNTGANASSSVTSYGAEIGNTHSGASSVNIGAKIYATGGATNYSLDLTGAIRVNGTSSGAITIQPAAAAGTYTLTLPTDDGDNLDVLQTNGSGVLDWVPMSGGGTPAGNFGNLQINRNGALATPASDSLDFESATGLTAIGGFRTGGSFGGVAQRIYDNASDLTISAYYATQFIANANGSWKVGSVNASDLAGVFATGTFYTNYTTILGQAGAGWNVGIGVGVPTGKLHIAAGTTTVAPQKQEAGVLLSTIQPLTKEANASSFYGSTVALNRYAEGGAIKDFIATVDNVGIGETDLFTYTTKASTLAADGEKLNFNIGGTFNDLTATAQLQFYFGGVNVGNTGALTVSATGGWSANVFLTRTSSTTVRSLVTVTTPGASTAVYTTQTDLTGLTLSGTNIIKITGTAAGASGGNGDISAKLGTITWIGAANN